MNIEEYAKYQQFYTDDIPQLLLEYLHIRPWKTYMDLGCGDGSLLRALSRQDYFIGKAVYAVDLSKNRIDLVKKIDKNFVCFVASADNIKEVFGKSIDVLVSNQLVEHVPDQEAMIKEIGRILSDSGTIYLSTVFKKWYGWYFYRCNGTWVLDPTHVREYSSDDQLLGDLEKQGFEILENKKTLIRRSLADFVFKRLKLGNRIFIDYPFLQKLRMATVPIPGYYYWEIVCKKK